MIGIDALLVLVSGGFGLGACYGFWLRGKMIEPTDDERKRP